MNRPDVAIERMTVDERAVFVRMLATMALNTALTEIDAETKGGRPGRVQQATRQRRPLRCKGTVRLESKGPPTCGDCIAHPGGRCGEEQETATGATRHDKRP